MRHADRDHIVIVAAAAFPEAVRWGAILTDALIADRNLIRNAWSGIHGKDFGYPVVLLSRRTDDPAADGPASPAQLWRVRRLTRSLASLAPD